MSQIHHRRVGDTLTPISVQLVRKNEIGIHTPTDLTDLTVSFKMVNSADGSVKVAANSDNITIDDAVNGKVSYDFVSADVNTAGIFWASFIVEQETETDTYPVDSKDLLIYINSDTQTAEEAFNS
jgi:hypothetical protein